MRKFKTEKGFDILNKRENWNEHPKAPTKEEKKELAIPYHIQKLEQKKKLKSFAYDPAQNGGLDFVASKVTSKYFGDPESFKSVFVSGGDAEKEYADFVKNEQETFKKKLVVESPVFKVNTIVPKHHNVDKYNPLLED